MCGNFKVTKFQENYERKRAQIEYERKQAQLIEFGSAVFAFLVMIAFAVFS